MPDIYCELHDDSVAKLNLPKYFTYHTTEFGVYGKDNLTYWADRIWIQDTQGIRYVKHRNSDPETTPVDMTEFMWVKLKSVPV